MFRYLIVALIICLLVAACGGTEKPLETQTVTLVAVQGGSDVSLSNDPRDLFPEEVGRVPAGTECALVDELSLPGHGGEVLLFYKVDCNGLIGWVRDWFVNFGPGQSSP